MAKAVSDRSSGDKPAAKRTRGGAKAGRPPADREGARGRRRDAEVLEAATKVFHEKSYADASVQDVADELGILKGSLYHYIKTKEDLLVWLLEDVHDDVERILQEVQAVEGLDPLDRLALYVRKQVLYNARNLPRISVYHHDAGQLSPGPLKALQQRRRAHEQVVVGLITEAQERGEVSEQFDARLLANCVFATMIWVYRWYRPGGRLKSEDLAELCVQFALAGVRGAGQFPTG